MGAPIKRIGDLEINQDLATQRRMWTIQRVGWGTMAAILAAALLGLFGHGPLSRATQGLATEGFAVEYDRLARYRGPSALRMWIQPDHEGCASVWIPHHYLADVGVRQIMPWPDRMIATDDGVRFEWAAESGSLLVTWRVEPDRIGLLSTELRSPGHAPRRLSQFIYP